jgi:hypothetical protein
MVLIFSAALGFTPRILRIVDRAQMEVFGGCVHGWSRRLLGKRKNRREKQQGPHHESCICHAVILT